MTQSAEFEDFWVFAYGSLIWRPDFEFLEAAIGRLQGWHRSMCILSTHYRGCAERPGLVLGLDHGGSCLGRAYRVEARKAAEVREALDLRELVTGVYEPRFLPVHLRDGRTVKAYAYLAVRQHVQYHPPQDMDHSATLIRQGHGHGGSARDYLAHTVEHLRSLGIRDRRMEALLRLVDQDEDLTKLR